MSRSGYDDYDGDAADLNLYRANTDRAFAGKRGQAFLREMLAAFDSLPEKKLIPGLMQEDNGEVCAIGSVGRARGLDMTDLNRIAELAGEDPDYSDILVDRTARQFDIAKCMVREIMYWNDELFSRQTPEERFARMRKWIESQIKAEAP